MRGFVQDGNLPPAAQPSLEWADEVVHSEIPSGSLLRALWLMLELQALLGVMTVMRELSSWSLIVDL